MLRLIRTILIGLFGLLIILVVVVAAVGFFTVRQSRPQTDGELRIPGLEAPVDIYRDAYGIPHIYATNQHDLFFAQGYVHAQDRFWQMDVWRHLGAGRLSEMFGDSQVDTDKYLRTMGWARVSEQEYEQIDSDGRAILEAYAQGVNAYLETHGGTALSLEYAVLKLSSKDYQVEPWTPLNSLTWAKAMAYDLGGNMGAEIYRANLLKSFTPEQVQQLLPPFPADNPVIVPSPNTATQAPSTATAAYDPGVLVALQRVQAQAEKLQAIMGKPDSEIGSNNWVISGKLTSTGMPLLANDPHLGERIPSIWYEIGLHCTPKGPGCPYDVTGFSFAGDPGVIIGHNDRIAWGMTNVGPDVQDLYIEKINPDNPNQYEVNGKWVDMTLVSESIKVSGGQSVPLTVRYTRHGPLLSDVSEGMQKLAENTTLELPQPYAISLRWTALEQNYLLRAVWKFNRAQNWDDFREGAKDLVVPAQNLVYADVDGNIGYQMPGKVPIRAKGDGSLPVPGWTDEYEWTGYIPFDQLPFAFNPPQGYIATANNAVVGSDYPYLITNEWDEGFRARRINQMIQQAPGPIDIAYVQKMQGDDYNFMAEQLVPLLSGMTGLDPLLAKAKGLFQNWDFQDRMDSAPAALFNVFWRQLLHDAFDDDLPKDSPADGGDLWFEIVRQQIQQPNSAWWDDRTTAEKEDRDAIFRKAFGEAVNALEKAQGGDPAKWQWGKLHNVLFHNETLGQVDPIGRLFNRGPYPVNGGTAEVNNTAWGASREGNLTYQVVYLPSMRMIVDLSNLPGSLSVHTTGQSGHAFTAHYTDMTDLWRNIQYHPMLFAADQVQASAKEHLHLVP